MVARPAGQVSMSGVDRVRPSIAFRPRNASLRPALDFCVWLSDMASRSPGPSAPVSSTVGRGL
jgi:hypothetical protein